MHRPSPTKRRARRTASPISQGFWSNATYTPLERPDNVTKEFYTPEEALAAEKAAAARENAQTEPGTVADVHYDFTQFGLDQEPGDAGAKSAHLAHRRSAKRQAAADHGRRKEDSGSARRRGEEAGWPLGLRADQSTRRPLHHHGRAGAADDGRGYNSNYQIVQSPGYVMILTEMIHDVRVIPLDGRPRPTDRSVSGWACRAGAGRATPSSSRRPTSTGRIRSGDQPRT